MLFSVLMVRVVSTEAASRSNEEERFVSRSKRSKKTPAVEEWRGWDMDGEAAVDVCNSSILSPSCQKSLKVNKSIFDKWRNR